MKCIVAVLFLVACWVSSVEPQECGPYYVDSLWCPRVLTETAKCRKDGTVKSGRNIVPCCKACKKRNEERKTEPECLLKDVNFASHNVGFTVKKGSWKECSDSCTAAPNCYAWSYVTAQHPVAAYRENCHMKDRGFKDGQTTTPGITSGTKGCGSTKPGPKPGPNPGPKPGPKPVPRPAGASEADMKCLEYANMYRARHVDTPMLKWDKNLAYYAQRYADKLAAGSPWAHSTELDRLDQGENLYWVRRCDPSNKDSCADKDERCREAHYSWYDEIKWYDYNVLPQRINDKCRAPDSTSWALGGPAMPSIGHFTQMVWKSSVKVGFGVAFRRTKDRRGNVNIESWVVARYKERGNDEFWLSEEIGPLKPEWKVKQHFTSC